MNTLVLWNILKTMTTMMMMRAALLDVQQAFLKS